MAPRPTFTLVLDWNIELGITLAIPEYITSIKPDPLTSRKHVPSK